MNAYQLSEQRNQIPIDHLFKIRLLVCDLPHDLDHQICDILVVFKDNVFACFFLFG